MDSHRLGWYATTVGKGEECWAELSRRYFEGKPRPITLADHAQLLEVAAAVGLDETETRRVLETGEYRAEIEASVRQMHDLGINSIPVLIFDVAGAAGAGDAKQIVHHGSGNVKDFTAIFQQLHQACA